MLCTAPLCVPDSQWYHGRFGLAYNKCHKRLGKVAHDRPKTKASEDESYAIQMLDEYAVQKGMKKDPKKAHGNFVGGDPWVQAMKKLVRDWLRRRKKKKDAASGTDPPDSS